MNATVVPSGATGTTLATAHHRIHHSAMADKIRSIRAFQHIDEQFMPEHTGVRDHRRCPTIRGEIRPTDASCAQSDNCLSSRSLAGDGIRDPYDSRFVQYNLVHGLFLQSTVELYE
jgi:hypothetical protein